LTSFRGFYVAKGRRENDVETKRDDYISGPGTLHKKLFEYRVECFNPPLLRTVALQEWLNGFALQGWRLVTIRGGFYIFEREL